MNQNKPYINFQNMYAFINQSHYETQMQILMYAQLHTQAIIANATPWTTFSIQLSSSLISHSLIFLLHSHAQMMISLSIFIFLTLSIHLSSSLYLSLPSSPPFFCFSLLFSFTLLHSHCYTLCPPFYFTLSYGFVFICFGFF